MPDDPLSPWPRFAVAHLSGEDLPPDLARRFPQLPVPSEGITGLAAEDRLTRVTAPDGTELIQLGHHLYGLVCLDPSNGQVVDMVTDGGRVIRGPLMVNSSVDQFIQTTRAATELFPYHDADPDADTEAAADALRAQLEPVDPEAWYIDGYWDTFYWDVAIGDYSPDQFEPPPPPL